MARFKTTFKTEVTKGIARLTTMQPLVEKDIAFLPDPVQKYLRYIGAIGKPKVQNFHAAFSGKFKRTENGKWMDITAEQYNFYDQPTRLFYISSSMFGIPFEGLHIYSGNAATMKIQLASLIPVVNAYGPIMTKGETVTLFNDMCVLAPATLIDKHIRWETIDGLTVKATFTNQDYTISAVLSFNEKGELINFVSDHRYMNVKGNTLENFRWSTPVKDYKEFNGQKLASSLEAIWHMPQGEYVYAQFKLTHLEYNVKTYSV
jgi:Family of unknown function (DUF6544)